MIDLKVIEPYMIEVDSFMESFVSSELSVIGADKYLNYALRLLDCTKVWDNGLRPMQTITYTYRHDITEFVYVVNTFVENDNLKDDWFTKLIDRHNKNIEYEKINPPVLYGDAKAKKKFEKEYNVKSKTKNDKDKKDNKEKRITNAERKLAAHVARINSLSIKIKPH